MLKDQNDSTINEKYIIINTFYEKYIELLYDKMIDNIEQNLILKFNLNEILVLNETYWNKIKNIEEIKKNYKDHELIRLIEDKNKYEKIVSENEKEREFIGVKLERNMKIKFTIKKILLKFLSNTQIKEMKDLQQEYISAINEKKEYEIKNKKYQELFNSLLKEKEDKDLKISELTKELEIIRKKLSEKDKIIYLADIKLDDLEKIIRDQKTVISRNQSFLNNNKSLSPFQSDRLFYDDMELKLKKTKFNTKHSTEIIYNSLKNNKKNLSSNAIKPQNYLDLFSKIPRVTADLYSLFNKFDGNSSNNLITSSNSITNLKNNLNNNKKNSFENKSVRNKPNGEYIKIKDSIITSKNESNGLVNNKIKCKNFSKIEDKNNELNIKDFMTETVTKSSNKNTLKKISNITDIKNTNQSISVSPVTLDDETCLSQLDIMEHVLNLDGIKLKKHDTNININPLKTNKGNNKIIFSNGDSEKYLQNSKLAKITSLNSPKNANL